MSTEELLHFLKRGEWEPNIGVILLASRKKVGSLIDLAGTVDCGKGDVVAVAHRPQSTGDAVEKQRPTAVVIHVSLGGLVGVRFHEHLLAAK